MDALTHLGRNNLVYKGSRIEYSSILVLGEWALEA